MRNITAALLLVTLCLLRVAPAHADADTPPSAMPPGIYKLDPRHTSVLFRINHLGFSHFTGRFDHVEGSFDYHPDAPEQSTLDVTIYPGSIDTNDKELDDDLVGANWFDALKYPRATFHATHIMVAGDHAVKISGDFTLHGVTHNMVLNTVLVGAGTESMTGDKVMGFSANGVFDRSAYDISNLEPFIGDEVSLQIDTEFDHDPTEGK